MSLTLRSIAHSETGLVRKTNQDSGYVSDTMLLVADGMGGAAAGDVASAAAALALAQADVTGTDQAGTEAAEPLARLRTQTLQANSTIARLIAADPSLDGMGTTVCGGIFDGTTLHVVHIGDSRGYILSGGRLHRITHDHSYVQSLIDEGRLDERGALTHPHRSLLLKVLNGQGEIKPDYFSVDIHAGDRIMFCSDGLSGLVSDADIAIGLTLSDVDHAMTALVNLAHAAGATDNITIALADVVDVPGPAEPGEPGGTVPLAQHEPGGTVPGASTVPGGPAYPSTGLLGAAADPAITGLLRQLSRQDTTTDAATTKKLSQVLAEKQRYTPAGRRSRRGFWVIGLIVVLALGAGAFGVWAYISHQFYVGANQGQVAIYQGLTGTIAGIETSRLYETTTIRLADLPVSWRDKVTATIPMTGGLDQAHATVSELKDKSISCLATRASRPAGSPQPADGC